MDVVEPNSAEDTDRIAGIIIAGDALPPPGNAPVAANDNVPLWTGGNASLG